VARSSTLLAARHLGGSKPPRRRRSVNVFRYSTVFATKNRIFSRFFFDHEVALRQRTTTARALLLFSRSSARTMTITLYGPQQTRAMRATWMLRE
jgi:hypothetical protein